MTSNLVCGICEGDGGYDEGSPDDLYLTALEGLHEAFEADRSANEYECCPNWDRTMVASDRVTEALRLRN